MILGTPTGVEMIGLMQPFAMSLAYQEWTLIAQVDDSLFSFEMNLVQLFSHPIFLLLYNID